MRIYLLVFPFENHNPNYFYYEILGTFVGFVYLLGIEAVLKMHRKKYARAGKVSNFLITLKPD